MLWRYTRVWPWLAWASLAFGLPVGVAPAAPVTAPIPDASAFLEQTEQLRTVDHARFLHMLEQLHGEAPRLTPGQQWQVRYLDAWQAAFEGDYDKADPLLRDVAEHSDDKALAAKASALLMSDLGLNHRYEEAFVLANRLVADLPDIHDRLARFTVLANVSQLLGLSGQNDLALNYARMMEETLPPGETLCNPLTKEVTALYNAHRLEASSPQLRRAIDTCVAAGQKVFANAMWLVMGSLYLDEHQPAKALALLEQVAPGIRASKFYSHTLALRAELAQGYADLGDDDKARNAALAAVGSSSEGEISGSLKEAYQALYRIEKKRGHAAAALAYFEKYVVQDKGYLNDISARALAYQVVQQQVLTKKLETESLSRQNSILRLQRALDSNAMQTSRLYILLLLVSLASILFWLIRLKRSQLRFKRLSCLDGLTGIANHQHFISEADRLLRVLERKLGNGCLIAIDLDHFKRVNDTHGHAMGDEVLRRTAIICRQQLRPADLFGRLGGEEFGILLHECSREQGMEIANRIRAAIAETILDKGGDAVSISASIGLACTDASGYELQCLCMDADAALYRAKAGGRNRVVADTDFSIAVVA